MASKEKRDQVDPQTLQFIYEYIKMPRSGRMGPWRDLDGKLFQTFGVGGVVLGLGGLAGAQHHSRLGTALLVTALVAFAVLSGAAIFQIWPKRIERARFGDTLWPDFWNAEPDAIRHGIVEYVSGAYATNKHALGAKALALKVALIAASAEVGLVVLAVIADRLA